MTTLQERLADRVNTRRYRQRRAGLLPPVPTCPSCGKGGIVGATAPLCRACWLRTPAGLEWNRERNRRQYKLQQLQQLTAKRQEASHG